MNNVIDSNYVINFNNCVLIKSMYVLLLMNSTRNLEGPNPIDRKR